MPNPNIPAFIVTDMDRSTRIVILIESGICTPNLSSLAPMFRDLSVHPDRQTDQTWAAQEAQESACQIPIA